MIMLGLVGRKVGMTRVFTDDGDAVPVTVLDVANNRVTQIKTAETDGYAAVQVTYGKRRASRVAKPQAGHLAKAGVEAGELLKEFTVAPDALPNFKVGEGGGAGTVGGGGGWWGRPGARGDSSSISRARPGGAVSVAGPPATISAPTARRTATRVR